MAGPYPSLPTRLAIGGVDVTADALLDTGFDGYVVVPAALIATLLLPLYRRRIRTASGQVVRVPVYLGTVELLAMPGPIPAFIIALGDEYLLGLAVLNHFKVTLDHGQRVIIEP